MRRGRWADEQDRLWAAADDGVIKAERLIELGVAESTVYRRCRAGGPWKLLAPGIVLLSNGTATTRQWERAALLHGGPTAMLTGTSGSRHHGMRRGEDPVTVHVLVAIGCQVRSVKNIIIERTRRLPAAQERDGLPVAPLVRCVLDQARRMTAPTEIAAILTEPVQRQRLLPEELAAELDAGCRKHSATPRRIVRAVGCGVQSPAEFEVFEWWNQQPELPPAEWNVAVHDEDGHYVAMVDCFVRKAGFGLEVDSVAHHFATPEQVDATAARLRALRAVGLQMLSLRPTQRRDDPAGTLRDILDGLAIAARMPTPRATFGSRPSDAT